MEVLLDEVLRRIFSLLPIEKVASIRLVCRRWHDQVINCDVLFSMVDVAKKLLYERSKTIKCGNVHDWSGATWWFEQAAKFTELRKKCFDFPTFKAIETDNLEIWKGIKFDDEWFRRNFTNKHRDSVIHQMALNNSVGCMDHLLNLLYEKQVHEKVYQLLNVPFLKDRKSTVLLHVWENKDQEKGRRMFDVVNEFLKKNKSLVNTTGLVSSIDNAELDRKTITYLAEMGFINFDDSEEFCYIIESKNMGKTMFMLEKGAKLDKPMQNGVTPLHVAFSCGFSFEHTVLQSLNLQALSQPTKLPTHQTLLECLAHGLVCNPLFDITEIVTTLKISPNEAGLSLNGMFSLLLDRTRSYDPSFAVDCFTKIINKLAPFKPTIDLNQIPSAIPKNWWLYFEKPHPDFMYNREDFEYYGRPHAGLWSLLKKGHFGTMITLIQSEVQL